jgi:carbonic anhydrase/SulP family sulfate permease
VSTKGFRPKYEIADVINFVDFSSRELQQDLTPERVLAYLRAGNERFRTGTQLKRDLGRQMVATAVGQHPVAVVLSCIDSRSPAEILFDMGLGDIFSVRVAGNVATDEVLGSMEFACAVAGAKLVVVLGHTRCGAVNAAVQVACHPEVPVAPECVHLAPIMESIGKSVDAASCRLVADAAKEGFQNVADDVAAKNVGRVVAEIRRRSGVLDRLIREGRVGIVGMVYDVGSGTTRIVPDTLAGLPADAAMPA